MFYHVPERGGSLVSDNLAKLLRRSDYEILLPVINSPRTVEVIVSEILVKIHP